MSSQFRGYCKSDGAVRLGFFSLFGANFHRGMLVDSDYFGNPVACAELNGVPANYIGGIPVTAAGRICISESAVSGNGPSGGLRVTAAGKLACVQTSPNVIHQGVGLSNEGALCYESAIPRGTTFDALLLNNVSLRVGVGSATFTRATVATVTDHEDVLRNCLSGEVRFQGARRVRNYVAGSSENFTNANWTKDAGGTGSAPVLTANYAAAPDGTTTATRVVFNKGAGTTALDFSRIYGNFSAGISVFHTGYIKSNTGSPQTLAFFANGTQQLLNVTTSWTRFSFSSPSGNSYWWISTIGDLATTQAPDFLLWGAQQESVAGSAVQAPSEYVSVGVLSSPFHGAMVDGVKYFATTNGNTVASNVVTEATGSPISLATLKGYQQEGARTNLCLQSEVLGTTWAAPAGMALASNNTTAPDGAATADKLTDDGGTSGHYIEQTGLTFSTATAYTFSAFVKWASGTRNVFLQFYTNAGVDQAYVILNSSGAVVTSAAVGLMTSVSASVTAYPSGWYRVRVTGTTSVAAGAGAVRIGHGNGSSAPPPGYTGNGTDAIYAWGAQLEAGSFSSTYIPTTTASVTRNAEFLVYLGAGNISVSVGSAYAEACWNQAPSAIGVSTGIIETNGAGPLYTSGGGVNIVVSDGTNVAAKAGLSLVAGTVYKFASSWGGSQMLATASGLSAASGVFDGSMGSGLNILIGGAGYFTASPMFGTIRRVRISLPQFTATQLSEITA